MKVGILNAIHPADSKVDWGGSPIDAYVRFFRNAGAPFDFEGYEAAQGQLPSMPDACDAYVITGSPKGVYDSDPWIGELADFVRASYAAGKKLIGICFGHQLLAHALGGHAEKSDKGWGLGLNEFAITQEKAWMTAPSAPIRRMLGTRRSFSFCSIARINFTSRSGASGQ